MAEHLRLFRNEKLCLENGQWPTALKHPHAVVHLKTSNLISRLYIIVYDNLTVRVYDIICLRDYMLANYLVHNYVCMHTITLQSRTFPASQSQRDVALTA